MCGVCVCVLRIYPKYLGIIQEYQTTLPASWETCMQVKKQELESALEQQTGSKLGKKCVKAVYCHPIYLNLYAEYIMRNARLDESQAWNKTAREI